jgi:hypothetical protein
VEFFGVEVVGQEAVELVEWPVMAEMKMAVVLLAVWMFLSID